MPRLLSVNVGLPRDIDWRGERVHTGIWKSPAAGRVMARRLNLDGDGQGDLAGHGGEQRAVMVYQIDSYHYWERVLGRRDFTYGQFGENFTIEGLPDTEVSIGDRYRIGGALFEVTQPRVTCYRVGIRMNEPQMAALLVAHHRPGFYFRVLEEGEVGAGDEIRKVADGPERMTVTEIDALLYLPGHPVDQLKRSLRIPALSPGWKISLRDLLNQETGSAGTLRMGNAGLAPMAIVPPPAWPGFRSVRVTEVRRETAEVASLVLEAADRSPLPAPLPGQFLVLRLEPNPALPPILRSYSLSGDPAAGIYRISVKREKNGVGGAFLCDHVAAGDSLEISAPRGSFALEPGAGPVVLLSAGIGATPVLAMLYALASAKASREVWWLYGARNGAQHPFARETQSLLGRLAHSHCYIAYSQPRPLDQLGKDYDGAGRLTIALADSLHIPRDADFYLCGPPGFLRDFTSSLAGWGVHPGRIHREIFGPEESLTPGIAARPHPLPHLPAGPAGKGPLVSFVRSGITVPWNASLHSLLELAEACDVPVKWACRTGVCHTCERPLVGGKVRYNPDPLEPPAEGDLLTCCSQPLSTLEIDL